MHPQTERAIPLTERAHTEFTRRYESQPVRGQRVLDELPRPQLHMGYGRPIPDDDVKFVLCYRFPPNWDCKYDDSVDVDVRFGRPDGEEAWINDNITADRLLIVVSVSDEEKKRFDLSDDDEDVESVLQNKDVFDLEQANILSRVNIEAVLAHAYRTQLALRGLVVM